MGQSFCRRRMPLASEVESVEEKELRSRSSIATAAERRQAEERCEQCVLAHSRVGRESLAQCKTVGELEDYVADLEARERLLAGYVGADEREREGLASSG
ncbi:unnamed protein product [Symbiodinium natans]|uniref:Uncharacterized protein n=1 Tax=Symbiodinium natans TaxID=878477 RepID=A0A812QYT9_9DINO|nr:unnamed protein product [Symbiodinium natans]